MTGHQEHDIWLTFNFIRSIAAVEAEFHPLNTLSDLPAAADPVRRTSNPWIQSRAGGNVNATRYVYLIIYGTSDVSSSV